MVDIVGRDVRSRMLPGIRRKHPRPELTIRKLLFAEGYRYRLHQRDKRMAPPSHRGAISRGIRWANDFLIQVRLADQIASMDWSAI
ncbi:hypothetical protein [Cupriavidus taiwanensis]|uniref:hypothetical protein n=1 Tax=Cupriavidus taiwanensis TaxID=164546 RepID=UPI000E2FDD0A|nr:hypothetical protein [Cupriavidus taiwanensis]